MKITCPVCHKEVHYYEKRRAGFKEVKYCLHDNQNGVQCSASLRPISRARPTKRRFMVVLECDTEGEEGIALPTEDQVIGALAHSTAAEALSEALDCTVRLTYAEEGDFR